MRKRSPISKKCKIEFRVLDGADHGESCPKCGAAPNIEEEEEPVTVQATC